MPDQLPPAPPGSAEPHKTQDRHRHRFFRVEPLDPVNPFALRFSLSEAPTKDSTGDGDDGDDPSALDGTAP